MERKLNGPSKKEMSRAMICLTEGAQQLKSMLLLWMFQIVRRSLGMSEVSCLL